ncbi:MAG TPA: F0F1 ATP synthase subunit B [Nitriliruptorales bacterium]
MSTLVILATAAEGGERSGVDVILPAPAELFYGFVAFVILYAVLSRFAFPKLNEMLEARRAEIQGKLEESEQRLSEADEIKQRYEAQLSDTKNEANRIIEEAKSTAESLRRDIVAKAEVEAQTIVSRAQSEITAERDRALQQLREEVGTLSVELAGKIVEKELDAASHQQLVDRYISNLSGSN